MHKSSKDVKGKGVAAFCARVLYLVANPNQRDYWILDSEVQKHISFQEQNFDAWNASPSEAKIILGDASVLLVEGIGSILLAGEKFKGMSYVPKMKTNLLSA